VLAESGIDALSFAALHPDEHARYASTGGTMNPNQPALIRSAIGKMGQGARVVIATDNDEPGRDLAGQIEAIAREAGREDLLIVRDLPAGEGSDWNDVLRAGQRLDMASENNS
jgi:DNA primase